MKTLELEQMLLPQSLPVSISRSKVAGYLFAGFIASAIYFFAAMAGGYVLGNRGQPLLLGVLLLVFGLFGLWMSGLVFLQALNNLTNASTPSLIFTDESLRMRGFSIPWGEVKALTLLGVSNGRKTFAYVHLDVADTARFPVSDMTETVLPYFFKRHKRRLKLPPSAVLVPLERFNLSSDELMILLKRYWSKATGQLYKPQSVELLYPQKKFSDFAQKH